MTAAESSRRVLPGGVAGLVLNLLCWGVLLGLAPPIDPNPFPEIEAQDEPSQGMRFELQHCFDCPAFSAFGKEFGSTWDPLPVKLFLLANWPALWSARGPAGPWGLAPLNAPILLIVSSSQWLLLGAAWKAWQTSRKAKHSSPMVEA